MEKYNDIKLIVSNTFELMQKEDRRHELEEAKCNSLLALLYCKKMVKGLVKDILDMDDIESLVTTVQNVTVFNEVILSTKLSEPRKEGKDYPVFVDNDWKTIYLAARCKIETKTGEEDTELEDALLYELLENDYTGCLPIYISGKEVVMLKVTTEAFEWGDSCWDNVHYLSEQFANVIFMFKEAIDENKEEILKRLKKHYEIEVA